MLLHHTHQQQNITFPALIVANSLITRRACKNSTTYHHPVNMISNSNIPNATGRQHQRCRRTKHQVPTPTLPRPVLATLEVLCITVLVCYLTIPCTTAQFLRHGLTSNITYPPTIIKQPGYEQLYQVSTGDETDHPFTLDCEASGVPEIRYWWTKNGARFDYVAYDKRIQQKPKLGSLIFLKPENVDEGLYQCFAENELGTSMSSSVFLRRSELSSFPEERPREIVVDEGDPFSIDCSPPSGYPKPIIFWMILSSSGALHSINSSRLTVDPEGKLHFSNVTKSDQLDNALYACSATSYHRTEYKVGRKTKLIVSSKSTGLVNHHAPEAQYLSPPQVQVLRGQRLVLHCIYGGTPLPDVIWRKKGGSLEGNRISYQNFGKTLVIFKVDEQDEGTYECTASNGHGSQLSHAMQVSVSAAPYWIRAPNNTNAAQDESVHFECLAEGDPKPNLEWLVNGQPISTQKRPSIRIDGTSLHIDAVKKTDVGVFQCNASNIHGYAFRDFYLNVLDLPPVVIEPPEKLALAVQASTVTLKCRVFGAPKPKIKWRRENVELSGGRYKVLDNGDLQIEFVMPNDQGTYQCKAANKFAEISVEGELHVKIRTTIQQKPESIEIPAGKMAVLRCNAESDPSLPQEVIWLYNGKRTDLDADPRMIQSRDNSLTITKTRELDSGNYTCLAKTPLDQDSASATLTVQDVPNPPRITGIECEKTRATIQWTSTGDRRAPILGYTIQQNTSAKPDIWEDTFGNIAASDPRFSLNLTPWMNYTFRVVARNKIGQSLPSEPSSVCTSDEAPPSSNPTDVKGRGTTPSNLVISWTAMDRKFHHAPGFRYKIYWKRDDVPGAEYNTHIINDWKESRYVVIAQPTFVPYRIKVEAQNNRGQSTMAPDEVIGFSGQDLPTQEPKNFRLVKLVSPSKGIFSWDPVPFDSIRGRFKGYRISSWIEKEDRDMNAQEVMLGNVTTAEIGILNPFANNSLVIAAANELFSGPPSNHIIVTTPEGVPEAVPSLVAAPMGTSAFYLVWKRPEKVNGILVGYEIYYEEVQGTELKERSKRRPSIDDPLETKAKLANLKPNTKYRITIVAKTRVGEGAPYFIESTTNGKTGTILPDQPSFIWSKLPDTDNQPSLFGIRVTWLPNYRNGRPGSAFQVQFKKLDYSGWQTTRLEEHVDTIEVKGLESNSAYEVRVLSADGNLKTSSNVEVVSLDGGYTYRFVDPLADPTWLIALICALVLLMIIFFLVCFVKQNRGGKYLVYQKEVALGRDTDDPEEGFDEYKGVHSSVTRPLRGEPSLNSLNESDEDSLTDFEGDRSKFEEDGSFIGQYGVKRKHELPTIQTPGVATFV